MWRAGARAHVYTPFLYLGNQRFDFVEIKYEASFSTSIAGAHFKVEVQVHVHTPCVTETDSPKSSPVR